MKKKVLKKILFGTFIICLIIGIILLAITSIYITNAIKSVKCIDVSLGDVETISTTIYSEGGEEINLNEAYSSNYISLDDINEDTINAFLSIEDKAFYKHNGINLKRIVKASLNNLKAKSFKEGASTITQQLVKNRYLSNEKTIDRKIKEAYLAIKLENTESKDKILETYLNTIYYGNGAYGIYDASKKFFDKEPKDLTLSEGCVLAGVIKSPNNYSPINNLDNCIKRRNLILREMLEDKSISEEEYRSAIEEEIIITDESCISSNNIDLYNKFVIDEAMCILNKSKQNIIFGGYKIYTYQDSNLQKILDDKINDDKYYPVNSFGNIAESLSMIIENDSYTVSAVAGRSKYNLVGINRQPGSLIKPIFSYAPAIEEKTIYPITQVLDEETNFNGYVPRNVGNKYYGYVSIKDAIAKSLNVPAVKVCKDIGIEKCKEYAKKVGIEFSDQDNGYALALGGMTEGVTLKDITDSYSVFSNSGNYVKSRFISKIIDKNNLVIYDSKMTETSVYSEDTSSLMTNTLMYSTKNGTSKKLENLTYNVAGKTGTVAVKDTNLNTDAYSLAYTNDHTMSVWFGNYTMKDEFNLEGSNNGGTYATQIIADTFNEIYRDRKPANFEKPKTVVDCIIDGKTLEEDHIVVLGNNVPERYQVRELFSINNLPKNSSSKFNKINPFNITVTPLKNSIKISFDCSDYIDYKIYRSYRNNIELLNTVKNKNGLYEYIDVTAEPNLNYSYYVECETNYADKKYKTPIKYGIINKEYSNLLENNNTPDYNWIFA